LADEITIEVTRFNPDQDQEPRRQAYTIPYREDMVVLDALNYIKNHVDGSLSYRWSCRMGICGSCGMNVNGHPKLTCAAFLRDYFPQPVLVEPLSNFPVVRDLVIDMSDFMAKLSQVKPWIVRREEVPLGGGQLRQSPAQVDRYYQFSSCINCMLCYAACPVYALEPKFLGPAAVALARRYNLDSRDQAGEERLAMIAESHGIWDCTFVGECSVACPKGVDPAKAIQQSKFDSALSLLLPFGASER
jgi:fumarate reductase iron-sulfur subunit